MTQLGEPTHPLLYIVDDDAEVRDMLQQYLGRREFEVVGLPTADEMLHRLTRRRPDLVILDVMMPGTGGLEALRRLRADGDDIPVILLTARTDEDDRIAGLDLGADDYLGKPFNPRELLSRVNAVMRRRSLPKVRLPEPEAPITVGPLVLDPLKRTLTRNGEPVPLKDSDFTVLRALTSNPLKPLTRDRLLELSGQRSRDRVERSIDVQIMRLRRLIETDPDNPTILQTVRGVGYVYVPG
jgi:two-component system phosphate regulon response regulator OmpR